LERLGFVRKVRFGRYEALHERFIEACRSNLPQLRREGEVFASGWGLAILAAHGSDGICHHWRASGADRRAWARTAGLLAKHGIISPVDNERTRLADVPQPLQHLVAAYRSFLVSLVPKGTQAIHQSGCEVAYVARKLPAHWSELPQGLFSTDGTTKGGAIILSGRRRLNELHRLLLAGRASSRCAWNQRWRPTRACVELLASRLAINQIMSPVLRHACAFYEAPGLENRLLDVYLEYTGFPGSTASPTFRPSRRIQWTDPREGANHTRYGILNAENGPKTRAG
jgi:hypothetical protein